MSPNGRRAWRKWCKSRRRKMNAHHRALYTGANIRKAQPVELGMPIPKPFTTRSLVGMTMGSRKRAIARCEQVDLDPVHRLWFRLGQRLRPCPGCCACWGADVSPADFGYDAECFGPRVTGHTKREIRRMWKWQRNLVDDCDGSGVLPARKDKT